METPNQPHIKVSKGRISYSLNPIGLLNTLVRGSFNVNAATYVEGIKSIEKRYPKERIVSM
ncbi:MAG: hypothetical protein AAF798_05740 [Bacteroidota bacterium]